MSKTVEQQVEEFNNFLFNEEGESLTFGATDHLRVVLQECDRIAREEERERILKEFHVLVGMDEASKGLFIKALTTPLPDNK